MRLTSTTFITILSIINHSVFETYSFAPPRIHQNSRLQNLILTTNHHLKTSTKLYSSAPIDDDIQNQLAKARKLLEETDAKLAAAAAEEEGTTSVEEENKTENKEFTDDDDTNNDNKRDSVIKSTNEETGLITTDGELMAALSEEEDWEIKSLMDVFESESENGRHDVEDGLASRDVAASIFNLRLQMQNEDYKRIFDKRNRFIGEDN